MPSLPKFQKEFTVSSYELNPGGQARLTTVANYFQEIAHRHANELRFGYEDMKNHRTMWLLTRMKIRMTNYPMWNEKIRIETWPSGVDKLFFIRDYMVMNDAGVEMGKATSYWLIVNIETHRPVRSREALEQYGRIVSGEPVFDIGLEKIDLPNLQDTLGSHKVLYSDLDIVGHVNNVKYMEWCIDTAIRNGMQDKEIREFEINFLREALFGDEIVISGMAGNSNDPADPAQNLFMATRKADGKEIFRARIGWSLPAMGHSGNSS